jgi:AbrB family looped-hinge helix DNA binding protein
MNGITSRNEMENTNYLLTAPKETPMSQTILSSKGQVIIPKPIRNARHWKPGQQLEVIESGDGILLRPVKPFPATTLAEVTTCLNYQGEPQSLTNMEEAVRQGAKEAALHDSD